VLIDEGHDFAPEWLKLVTQMVDPATNSLLVLYDDAQSIYERARSKQFSFKSVGIQAQGRTTILKINYRNTKQISANRQPGRRRPADRGRQRRRRHPAGQTHQLRARRQAPIIIKLPSLREEAYAIADQLARRTKKATPGATWPCCAPTGSTRDLCADALHQRKLPFKPRKRTGDFDPAATPSRS
jgi:superfamily I DNA/RNA helicase